MNRNAIVRSSVAAALFLLLAVSSAPLTPAQNVPVAATPDDLPYASDHIIVKFKQASLQRATLKVPRQLNATASSIMTGLPSVDDISADLGVVKISRPFIEPRNTSEAERLGVSRALMIHFATAVDIEEAVRRYSADPNVEFATPDWRYLPAQVVPSDPAHTQHWGHNNTGQLPGFDWGGTNDHTLSTPVGTPGFDANAELGWEGPIDFGSANVVIAMIDTGANLSHPDLTLVAGWDYGSGDSNPEDNSPVFGGHGTACAGVAAAKANNGIGACGAAPGCRVMPLKVSNNSGTILSSYVANAFYHAADNGAEIISISLSVSVPSDPLVDPAITYATNAGLTILAAAGNFNANTISYPANQADVIAVGAASPCGERKRSSSNPSELGPGVTADPNGYSCDGERAWGSSYGSNMQNNAGAIDVVAPTILYTTDIQGAGGYRSGDYEPFFNGTSCATPYAAGVCALIKSRYPAFTPAQIRAHLVGTAQDIVSVESGAGWDRYTGYGMVDINAAVGCQPKTVANFSATPLIGYTPLTVNFTDLSTHSPSAWSWDFSDGTSSAQNPSHQFVKTGPYTVSLSATNACGTDNETKSDYVFVKGCGDGIWEDGENCGQDAYTVTGSPDMNHDCVVDGLDIGAFLVQLGQTGVNLSADLGDDGEVTDFEMFPFLEKMGMPVSPCNPTITPGSCDGTIALSFSADSTTIVSSVNQAPGVYTAYVVINNFANARVVEYAIQTSYNVAILDHRPRSGTWLHGCLTSTDDPNDIVIALGSSIATGPAIVAMIRYQLTDSNPASLTIAPSDNCRYRRIRWATSDVSFSHDFVNILNAGINSPAPAASSCTGTIGTIVGRVYEDRGSDCSFVAGVDVPVANRVVEANPGGYTTFTDADGKFVLTIPAGQYTVTMQLHPNDVWREMSDCQGPEDVTVGVQTLNAGVDFALKPLGSIAGRIYEDLGNDCQFVLNTDVPISNRELTVTPGGYSVFTDVDGNYYLDLQIGQYTVSLPNAPNDPFKWMSTCQPATHDVTVSEQVTADANDFAMMPIGTIAGRVYKDIGNDCVFNGTDFGIGNRMIEINPGGYIAFTDANGYYAIDVVVGPYTVTPVFAAGDPWSLQTCQTSSSYVVNVTTSGTFSGNDFALQGDGPCDVWIGFVSRGLGYGPPPCNLVVLRTPCPGVKHEYLFMVQNKPWSLDQILPGTELNVTLGTAFTINSVSSAFPISIVGSSGPNQRTVQLDGTINPGQTCVITVHATPSADGPYTTQAALDDGGNCSGYKSTSQIEASQCSCDPNDMAVEPAGCGPNGEIVGDTPLTYTIRFENVGLGQAHNIFVRDELDDDLDLGTFRIVSSSHPVTGVQVDPGNELVVSFEGIELPGTYDPQANNKGYVVFMIDPKPGLVDGTTIENTAAITFDYNEPVITNTVLNTIQSNPCPATAIVPRPTLPTVNTLSQNHPNPFNPSTTIQYGLVSPEQTNIAVYNVRGELVQTLVNGRLPAGWHTVEWNGRDQRGNSVASGVYLYRMRAGSFVNTKKLVLLK